MSDDAPAATEVANQETTIPNSTPTDTTPTPEAPTFESIVPAEFADKAWVQDVKNIDGFFKMADDMKSELGRRAEAAAPKAPETVEGYELSEPANPEFQAAIKDLFLKNGVPAEMAKGLDEGWNELVSKFAPNQEELDAEFAKMTDEVFGNRADEAVQIAKNLLAEHTPESMKDQVNALGNKELTIMASVLDSIQAKYINEDDLPRERGGASGAESADELRSRAKAIMATPEWSSKAHPGHAAAAAEVARIYDAINLKMGAN